MMEYFFQGLTMGLAYVAPIGMQNLFVISTALTQKRSHAFLTALIVIFFDVTLALACFWWVGAVMRNHPQLQRLILGIGSIVVFYIGLGLLRSKPGAGGETYRGISWRKTISFACVVTWFNPQAVIDGTMMLGAFHAMLAGEGAVFFITGVAVASMVWFLSLTAVLSMLGSGFRKRTLRIINIVSGLVIMFYGCLLMKECVMMFL